MPGVSKIYHKEREIVYVDYRGCSTDKELLAVLQAADVSAREDKIGLQLNDLRGVFVTKNFMGQVKDFSMVPPKIIKLRAILGVDNLPRKIMLDSYNMVSRIVPLVPFDDIDEAMDWLVTTPVDGAEGNNPPHGPDFAWEFPL